MEEAYKGWHQLEETMVSILPSTILHMLLMMMMMIIIMVIVMIMVMIMIQGVTLMKQTGLLCFADEHQNPFVTSVLASFEQVMMIMTMHICYYVICIMIKVVMVKRNLLRRMWSTQFIGESSSKKPFHTSPSISRYLIN